jgi:hypothetical protein
MSLRPVVIEQFPGLDLRQDPGDSAGAIDALNVTLDPGRVRSRGGTSTLYAPAGSQVNHMKPFGQSQLIIYDSSGTGVLTVITPAGAVVGSTTTTTSLGRTCTSVAIGTTAGSFFYFTHPVISVVKRWDGATWTAPGTFPASIMAFGLSPTDNRLVACQGLPTGCKVSFSDPGAPETFGANNYVLLGPGDNEEIQGTAVFNNQLFIFKQTKFYVFYGTSTDSTGNPIFNYRTVDTGIGVRPQFGTAWPGTSCICATASGVYFIANDGVYRTTGGTPVKISSPLDPFWTGIGASPFWLGGTRGTTSTSTTATNSLTALDGRLYCAMATSTTAGITFVYDERLNAWTAWSIWPGAGVARFIRSTNSGDIDGIVMAPVGATTVQRVDPALTSDNGSAVVSRYRLPFETYGNPGEKRIREVIVEGVGTPTIGITADWSSTGITKALTLGTSPAISKDRMHNAWRGRAFSVQLSAASGAWAVNRVQANVSDATRPVAVTV